jgi:uncharacterized membrane protein YhaH (DUF805 family)
MEFTDAVKSGFKKYFVFSGRAARSEYWWWTLFVVLVFMVSIVFEGALQLGNFFGFIILALTLPSVSVSVRRFRDSGVSPFWLLIWLFPWASTFLFFIVNVPVVIALDITSLDPNMPEEQVMAFVSDHPELVNMVAQFLAVIVLFLVTAIIQFILAARPSKNPHQPAVATTDY